MKKVLFTIAFVSLLSFGFVANSHALTIFDGTKLIGAIVKAHDGVELGKISDLVVDVNGRVDFAIVDQVRPQGFDAADHWPGHVVAVPFDLLKISKGKSQESRVVFIGNKEKFYEASEAPSSFFDNGRNINLATETRIDNYFGISPYWGYSPY